MSAAETINERRASTFDPAAWIEFFKSSIGAKVMMAFSGAGLWFYLLLHVAGNLPVLWNSVTFNNYAEALQTNPILLWLERGLVFGGIAAHAFFGLRLTRLNRAAREKGYGAGRAHATSTFASRTMIISGLIILAFFVYHILHFTVHAVGGATFATETLAGGQVRPNSALMVKSAFSNPLIAGFYIFGQLVVFTHLYHGSVSLFQSFGLFPIFASPWVRRGAKTLALAITGAALSIPLVLFLSSLSSR